MYKHSLSALPTTHALNLTISFHSPSSPMFLVVGDRCNAKITTALPTPFFFPFCRWNLSIVNWMKGASREDGMVPGRRAKPRRRSCHWPVLDLSDFQIPCQPDPPQESFVIHPSIHSFHSSLGRIYSTSKAPHELTVTSHHTALHNFIRFESSSWNTALPAAAR